MVQYAVHEKLCYKNFTDICLKNLFWDKLQNDRVNTISLAGWLELTVLLYMYKWDNASCAFSIPVAYSSCYSQAATVTWIRILKIEIIATKNMHKMSHLAPQRLQQLQRQA